MYICYIPCLPVIQQTGGIIIEGDQITKAGFSLHEPMLTVLDNSFVLQVTFSSLHNVLNTFPGIEIRS